VYHPWYAYPDRLLILLVATGVVVGWAIVRLGQWLPARAHGLRHPVVAWSITLPLWIALAAVGLFFVPAAAYLWTVPLLAAGLLLSVAPPASGLAIRAASVVILGVAATLWLATTIDLARFVVATMGRLSIVTPVFVYPVLLAVGGAMIVPPMAGTFVATRRLVRPSLLTATALLVLAVAAGAAYRAPAYTFDAPQRRTVRVLQSPSGPAVWEIGSSEPGLDLMPGAPGGWTPASADLSEGGVPWGRLAGPFVFRTRAQSIGAAPIEITQATLTPVAGGLELVVSVTPTRPGLTVSFALPPGVSPARHNLPGFIRLGSWTATYVAVPADGVLFRAAFGTNDPAQVGRPLLLVSSSRIPGGAGWQSLPSWLPQERAVWRATATWAVPVNLESASRPGTPPVAPVPPLR
jgi:hypothetical protein